MKILSFLIDSSPSLLTSAAVVVGSRSCLERLSFTVAKLHKLECVTPLRAFTAGTPPHKRIASLICTGVSISLPAFRWILLCDLIVAAFWSLAALPSCRSEKIEALLEAKDYSTHHSEVAVITPSIVLTIINCLQLRHDYLQLTDYFGHHRAYRAAVLRSRVENMVKGKHFELTTMLSRGKLSGAMDCPVFPTNQSM